MPEYSWPYRFYYVLRDTPSYALRANPIKGSLTMTSTDYSLRLISMYFSQFWWEMPAPHLNLHPCLLALFTDGADSLCHSAIFGLRLMLVYFPLLHFHK